MAQTGQIIPRYLHPSDTVIINDNTTYTDYTSDADANIRYLCVFPSAKGRTGLMNFNNQSKWVEEYGRPNYSLYGQASYMPYVMLGTGLASCQCLRIAPKDAKYANLFLLVGYKIIDKKFHVKFKLQSYAEDENGNGGLSFGNTEPMDQLITAAESSASDVTREDADSYTWVPLMAFMSQGVGKYGNDYRIRITHDKSSDKENVYKNYTIDVLSTENEAAMIESFNVSFYTDAVDPRTRQTLFAEEVVDDEDGNGSQKITMHFFTDNYQTLFDKFAAAYNTPDPEPEVKDVKKLPLAGDTDATFASYEADESGKMKFYYVDRTRTDGTKDQFVYTFDKDTKQFKEAGDWLSNEDNTTAITSEQYWKLTETERQKYVPRGYHTVVSNNEEAKYDDVANNHNVFLTGKYDVTINYNPNTNVGTIFVPSADDASTGTSYEVAVIKLADVTGDDIDVIENTIKEELPTTEVADANVVYNLTQADGAYEAGKYKYDEANKAYAVYVKDETEKEPLDLTIENFDIFGYDRVTLEDNANMVIDDEDNPIMDLEGVGLQSGSDGSFDETVPSATRDDAISEAYKAAFDGTQDRMILNKRRVPVDQIYDANLELPVKQSMAALAIKRGDALLYLDCGLQSTTAGLETFIAKTTFDSYLISLNSGMMYTADPITGKNLPVSITLWLASAYPSHVYNNGWYTPFAGENHAVVSGYTSVKKIKPVYDEELDADTLEELFTRYHVNYLQALDENTIVRGTQITTQSKTSDLSKENNVMLTLEIKRRIERMISRNRYNWTDDDDIKNFKNDCNQVFSTYKGTKCKSIDVDVKQSNWEKTRYILHAYLTVVFRKYQERGIVEIDLNPS